MWLLVHPPLEPLNITLCICIYIFLVGIQVETKRGDVSFTKDYDIQALQIVLADVENQLSLAEEENLQYFRKCTDLEKQIEDLKNERNEDSRNFELIKKQWARKEEDFVKRTIKLENALEDANNRQALTEIDRSRYSNQNHDLTEHREELKSKSRMQSSKDKINDLSRKWEDSAMQQMLNSSQCLTRMKDLERQKKELEVKLEEMKTQLNDRTERDETRSFVECKKLEEEIKTYKAKLDWFKEDRRRILSNYNTLHNQLWWERDELENVKAKLDRAESDKGQYSKKYNDLKQQTELNSKSQCVDRHEHLRNLEEQLKLERGQWSMKEKDFGKEKTRLKKALEDAKNLQERTESDKSKYFEKCNYLQQEIEELKNELQCSKDERNKTSRNFEQQLKIQKENRSRKEEDFVKEKTGLKNALEDAENQLETAETEKSQYSQKCDHLEKQLVELESELQSFKDQRKELSRNFVRQLKLAKEQWLRKEKDFVKEKTDLEKALKDANNQLEIAETHKSHYLNESNDLNQQKANLEKELHCSEEERKELVEELKDLKMQKTLNEGQCSRKVQDLEKKNQELETKLSDLNTKKECAERDRAQKSILCKNLKQQLQTLEIAFKRFKDKDKNLSSKCGDVDQQLKRERGQWSKKEKDFGREKSVIENALAKKKSLLERAESEKSQYSKKCNDLQQKIEELQNKLRCSEKSELSLRNIKQRLELEKGQWLRRENDFNKEIIALKAALKGAKEPTRTY